MKNVNGKNGKKRKKKEEEEPEDDVEEREEERYRDTNKLMNEEFRDVLS